MALIKSSLKFTTGTFFSRISGLIRESILSAVFGASYVLDAFFLALRIPGLLRDLLAEGALGSSFTKVYSEVSEKHIQKGKGLFQQVFLLVLWTSSLLAIVGIFFGQDIVTAMTLRVGETHEDFFPFAVDLTQILLPYLVIAGLTSIVSGVLHQRDRFFLTGIAPAFFNIGVIAAAVSFYFFPEVISPIGLGWGVICGSGVQLLLLCWNIRSLFLGIQRIPWRITPEVRKVFRLMLPMTIAAATGPINVMVNTNFATMLGEGAVSWLTYAFRLIHLPVALVGIGLGIAVLTTLTKLLTRHDGNLDIAGKQLNKAVTFVLWLMLPCTIIYLTSGKNMIQLLFQHGRFTEFDTMQTFGALRAYSLGLLAYGLLKVLTAVYYSLDRMIFPMMVSIFLVAINFVCNFYLVPTWGLSGLAFTSSTVLSVQALLLMWGLQRLKLSWIDGNLLWHVTGASACAAICILAFQNITVTSPVTGVGKMDALITISIHALSVCSIFGLGYFMVRACQKINWTFGA